VSVSCVLLWRVSSKYLQADVLVLVREMIVHPLHLRILHAFERLARDPRYSAPQDLITHFCEHCRKRTPHTAADRSKAAAVAVRCLCCGTSVASGTPEIEWD
jgi:RNase P subunit RPR2